MNKKTVQAKIYDPGNGSFLLDITVEIEMISPSNPNGKPHYEVIGKILKRYDEVIVTINKRIDEISGKNLILEFNPDLRVSTLFIIISGSAPWLTEFKIEIQDSALWDSEWFKSL